MKSPVESILNVTGKTRYIDDLPVPAGTLEAAVKLSASARGRILGIDATRALALDPSVRVISARDIPGANQIGFTVPDEPLLPETEWEYQGQPVVLCLARTRALARRAAVLVTIQGEDLPAIIDEREAAAANAFVLPSRTMKTGNPEEAFKDCAYVLSGTVRSGGQEHVYLETQGAIAEVRDGEKVFVISGTQGPTGVQKAIAAVLNLPMNKVEVEARRLGGAFGGKEDQAATWGALAALGAWVSGHPVRLYLNRRDDIRATGKRHPYSSDYRIGMDQDGKILAFEADYYQNSGCTCDLSPAILSRTLFHATGAYSIPNVRVTGYMCRTNLPSFTAFRGFGAPQGFFVIECAIQALAARSGKDVTALRYHNLYKERDITHYGMPLEGCRTTDAFDRLIERTDWVSLRDRIDDFNAENRLYRKGAAILPVCFGISFTKLLMNQAGSLVHVYQDGSVLVSTGAIEMGQQVNRKIALAAAGALGVRAERVSVERTTTLTVANTVPTAASTGADLNAMAAVVACESIHRRLKAKAASLRGVEESRIRIENDLILVDGEKCDLSWEKLVSATFESRIDLSAHGYYATPGLFYDMKTERGSPFAYHVYGAACVEATVDILRGSYTIDKATIIHDMGNSFDEKVDIGQIEGAFAQGLGWALLEDLQFAGAGGVPALSMPGKLLSDTLSTYKLPDIHFTPGKIEIEFLPTREGPSALRGSKAVGEPPLIYGIAGYFAVLDALLSVSPHAPVLADLPLTPEKVLTFLFDARSPEAEPGFSGSLPSGGTQPRQLCRN